MINSVSIGPPMIPVKWKARGSAKIPVPTTTFKMEISASRFLERQTSLAAKVADNQLKNTFERARL